MVKRENTGEDKHIVGAITRLMRPLVRYLLARGFTYTRFIQIIRPLYVEVAETEYSDDTERLTDSRISVLTGLARRYVRELRQGSVPDDPKTLKSSPSTKLIAEWVTNPLFLDKRGLPKRLLRVSEEGENGFEELAAISTKDVRPRTLLDDLIGKGLIRETSDKKLELQANAYKPDKEINELIDYFGQHMYDHLSAATCNLQPDKPTFFERSAFQDGLTPESIKELQELSDEVAMEMLKTVYKRAAQLSKKDQSKANNTIRYRLGTYAYSEDEGDEEKS